VFADFGARLHQTARDSAVRVSRHQAVDPKSAAVTVLIERITMPDEEGKLPPIPDDLKERYDSLGKIQPTSHTVTTIRVAEWRLLIERVAILEGINRERIINSENLKAAVDSRQAMLDECLGRLESASRGKLQA
jgi:hypothetical protein